MLAGGNVQLAVPAADYYVSTLGNDTTGDGSVNNPWASLAKIASIGNQTVAKKVYIVPGNYFEFARLILPRKVSLFGAGDISKITYLYKGSQENSCIFIGNPVAGTGAGFTDLDASLSISYLFFNALITSTNASDAGSNPYSTSADCPIYVRGSSNVEIHHCRFTNFTIYGPTFNGIGTEIDPSVDPSYKQTGNSVHHCNIINCSWFSGTIGYGSIQFGNQLGFEAYNNYVEQIGRPSNSNGFCFKHHRNGYNNGCKIYNNTIIRSYDDGNWNNYQFAIEQWNFRGLEIHHNTIIGNTDLAGGAKGSYAFSIDYHHNVVGGTSVPSNGNSQGIELEYQALGSTSDVLIRSNWFRNLFTAIYVYREGLAVPKFQNVYITNNVFYNCRAADFNNSHPEVGGFDNWQFLNNTLDGAGVAWCGLRLPDNGVVTNVIVKNNIVVNTGVGREIVMGSGVTQAQTSADTVIIQNNCIPGYTGPNFSYNLTPTNVTNSGNITSSPGFATGSFNNINPAISGLTNYRLSAGSPCVNAGLPLAEITIDYLDSPRIGNPDIGAFEYA